MVTAWIGYCLLISSLFALAALAGEKALSHYRKPVRGAWVGAIVGSIFVPALAFLAPATFRAASPVMSADAPAVSLATLTAGATPAAPTAGALDPALLSSILGWLWVASALLLVLHLAGSYRRLRSEMRGWAPGMILDSPVLLSRDRGPAVVGLRRAVIVMPEWIAELEDRLLRLVFLHEREHRRAGDHRLYCLGLAALLLAPWNPVLWWQLRRLQLAIEYDCDRRVLAAGASAREYADALIAVGGRVSAPLVAAAAFAERKPEVECRLRRLSRLSEPLAKLRAPRTLGASGVAALAIILVLGAPPPAGLETPSVRSQSTATTDAVVEPSSAERYMPPPRAGTGAGDRPAFIPYDTPPVMINRNEVVQALARAYPAELEEAGIGGRTEIWLYISEDGRVERQSTKTSSGNPRLDAAAEEVATSMRFKPAVNRDRPMPVWVSQWITFQAAAGSRPATDDISGDSDSDPLIVVDGVIQSAGTDVSDLGGLDIDRVEVIKGEAAERLYGDRAANGVVKITTKNGAGS